MVPKQEEYEPMKLTTLRVIESYVKRKKIYRDNLDGRRSRLVKVLNLR